MKKRLLLMSLLVIWCGLLIAEPITQQQALQKAQQFRKGKTFKTPKKMARISQKGVAASSDAAYYIFNAKDNGGFVIVSGDDRTEPILGYADSGQIDTDNMPENLQAWLEGYAEQIGALDNDANARKATLTLRTAIAPLITTQWNQFGPYNLQCPEYEGERCVTGCAATAIAQVMYYHQWPQDATTTIPAYTTSELAIELDELPSTTFKWGSMKDTYETDETGDAADAVAELMRYCGQSIKMDYAPSGSGAYPSTSALTSIFGYSKAARKVSRANYSSTEWENLIYNEISANRPVLYAGYNLSAGHEFVCDGCDAEGLFHINWGWGGRSDGYFVLSLLNPYDKGIGGGTSADGYTVRQEAVVGFEPDRGQELPEVAKTVGASIEKDFWGTETYLTGLVTSLKECEIECGWGLFDEGGNFLRLFGSSNSLQLEPESEQLLWNDVNSTTDLEDGQYFIYMVYRNDKEIYTKCIDAENYPITVSVSNNKLTLKSAAPQQNYQVNSVTLDSNNDYKAGTPQTVTLNLTNLGYTHEQAFYVWLDILPVGMKSAYLEHGETDDVSIIFTPMKGMEEAMLKITSDPNGQNVVFSENLHITSDGRWADGDLFFSKTAEGVEMAFKVISAADKTCQLGIGRYTAIDKATEGTITIPDAPEGFKITKIADRVFQGCSNLTKVVFTSSIAEARPTTAACWFEGCRSLEAIDGLEYVNTSKITNMSYIFYDCSALASLNVSGFNTSKVANMCCMFYNCSSLTSLDLSHFDTSNVNDMRWMFWGCSSLASLNVSSFNTSKVTSMYSMFCDCSSLTSLDVSSFDTSNVTEMPYTFYGCYSLASLDLSNFNTSNVKDMYGMFSRCYSLSSLDLSNFDTSNVEEMASMFENCNYLTSLDLSGFDMQNVYNTWMMFYGCTGLTSITLPTSLPDIEANLFEGCYNLITINSQIEDPTSVALNNNFFADNVYTDVTLIVPVGTKELYQETDGWNKFHNILEVGEPVIRPYAEFDESTGTVTFAIGEKEYGGNVYGISAYEWVVSWDDEQKEFYDNAQNIVKVVFDASFADARPKDTSFWFYRCSSLQTIEGIENLNTSKVTNMMYMFNDCRSLTSLDLSGFDARYSWNMEGMVSGCSSLTRLVLPSQMSSIGEGIAEDCENLTAITSLIEDPNEVWMRDNAFDENIYAQATLYVPAGTKALYQEASGWKNFANIVEMGDVSVTLTKDMVTFATDMPLDFSTPVEGLSAYVVTTVNDEGKALLKEVNGAIPGGTGLILLGTTGQTYTLPCATTATVMPTNLLVGVTTDTAISGDGTEYILKDGKFVKSNAGTLSGGKAYLKLNAADAREVIFIDTETTGISTAIANSDRVKSEIYNLNGQRVSKPQQKGVYIVNGKKVIKK